MGAGAAARRNLTITIDEDVARWARVRAAERDTSVAQMVGEMLRLQMLEEDAYEVAMRQHFAQTPKRLRRSGGLPAREQLHER